MNLKAIIKKLAKQDKNGHVEIGNFHFWVYEDGDIEGQKGTESFFWENMGREEREELEVAMREKGLI